MCVPTCQAKLVVRARSNYDVTVSACSGILDQTAWNLGSRLKSGLVFKIFQDFSSHQIFRHMYEALNLSLIIKR